MTRIAATDHILLLLREQLRRTDPAAKRQAAGVRDGSPLARLAALAAVEDLDERAFRKAFVRSLLAQRLGEAIALDPAFDAIAREVLRTIEADEAGCALLDRATATLRERAGPTTASPGTDRGIES